MGELDDLRDQIKDLDEEILLLVRRRNEAARRVGAIKRQERLPLQNFEVEKAVLDHALQVAQEEGVHEETARGLVRVLIQSALRIQERDAPQRQARAGRRALIVGGAGLMGQWFARFLSEQGYEVHVDDPRPSPWPRGSARNGPYDLVILSTPPSTIPQVLEETGAVVDNQTLLVDIASVKGDAVPVLRRLAKAGKRVASLHPMFGPQTDLLMGRNVLVLDAGQGRAAHEASALFAETAARTVPLPLKVHDELMAEVLSLAHATSLAFNHALASGPRPFGELDGVASTTFRKQVDVSREVARENPKLYFEIQALNAASGPALERLETSLKRLRSLVEARDESGFAAYMLAGRRYYGGA